MDYKVTYLDQNGQPVGSEQTVSANSLQEALQQVHPPSGAASVQVEQSSQSSGQQPRRG